MPIKKQLAMSTGFKNFRIEDEKKKWKKKNCKSFQGFGERIYQILKLKSNVIKLNT